MQIYNALDLKAGKKADYNRLGTLTQPFQFLCLKDKNDEWLADNINWLEMEGMRELRRTSRRLKKNYNLARGIIDHSDYIVEENPENADLLEYMLKDDESARDLKFYPLIPTFINTMRTEFAQRTSKMMFRASDDLSYNEKMEAKRTDIERILIGQAEQKMMVQMMQMGVDPQSEEGQQMMSQENLKTLPEVEQFYKKDYKSIYEDWATHQMKADVDKFRMDELEERGFTDMLVTDREFWHFRMLEDDYEVDLWNPLQVAYRKSPSTRYVSNASWVTHVDLLTVADAVDTLGWMMNAKELESLEHYHAIRAAGYMLPGIQNDGGFYDPTKSHAWNTQMPSLAMRQFTSAYQNARSNGDIIDWILSDSEDLQEFGSRDLLRVTTAYWKTQRKLYHLTKISTEGETIQDIVGEEYKVTEKPLYDTTFYKDKDKRNLVFGEHLEPIWINEVYGGIKVGPNRPATWVNTNTDGFDPIYLGVNGGKPGRIPFQFKGDNSLYGCKLPVEGCIFSDRNTQSRSWVDMLKPFQIGYNISNNQIADITMDEIGGVVVLDHNALPKHSMGEDWGHGNLGNAYIAMKNFQILPLDTSLSNTENALSFSHFQHLNLEQSNRLLTRIQLANYFKQQAMEAIGLNQTRMGQPTSKQTATEVEIKVNASYAQTEMLFTQHSDYLMPRVHMMRTELAQYYHANNPSVRLQYITTAEEQINFKINGTKLFPRDFNIYCSSKINSRNLLNKFKDMLVQNNNTGASIYDLGNIHQTESMSELDFVLKGIEQKTQKQRQEEMQQEQQLHQQEMESQERQLILAQEFEAQQNALDRESDQIVAEIRAASTIPLDTTGSDMDSYNKEMERINKQQQYQDGMNFKREQEVNKNRLSQTEQDLKRRELQTRESIANKQLEVARVNKNKYDRPKPKTKKK